MAMEKFKTGWKLTDEEKESFRLALKRKNTDQEKTERFIIFLQTIWQEIKFCLDFPKRDKLRDDQEQALKIFKKAMSVTDKILLRKKCRRHIFMDRSTLSYPSHLK